MVRDVKPVVKIFSKGYNGFVRVKEASSNEEGGEAFFMSIVGEEGGWSTVANRVFVFKDFLVSYLDTKWQEQVGWNL